MRYRIRNLFFPVVLLICLVMPLVICSMYSGFSTAAPQLYTYMEDDLALRMDLSAIRMAMLVNPDYDPIELRQEVPEDLEQEIRVDFYSYLTMMSDDFLESSDIHYRTVYNDTNTAHNWDTAVDLNDTDTVLYWYTFRTDSSGKATVNSSNASVSPGGLENELSGYYYYYTPTGDVNVSVDGDEDADIGSAVSEDEVFYGTFSDLVKIVLPESMEMNFYIATPLSFNSAVAVYFQRSDTITIFSVIWMLVLAGGMGLLILIWPYRKEKEAVLFSGIIRIKALPAGFLAVLSLASICTAVGLSTYYTVTGGMVYNLERSHIPMAGFFTYSVNYLSWFGYILVVALVLFYIKHIFAGGFMRFLREDTICACLWRWCKARADAVQEMDLSKGYLRTLIWLCLVLFGMLFFCVFIGSVFSDSFVPSLLLCAAAAIGVFILASRELEKISRDFQTTLKAASQLADGRFHSVHDAKVGLLQPIYNKLLLILPGFEKAVEEAMSSQNMKTELISNVSHDLKTPLTGIKNYVELIEQSEDIDEIQEYAEKLNGYCDRLDRLIVDLFDVSKANSGNIRLETMQVSLKDLIEQVQYEHEDEWLAKGLIPVFRFPEEPVEMLLDPNRTMRIFENLITNITKYALENTRVFIDVVSLPDQIMITYKNISKYPLEFDSKEIVERFARGDASRHESGSGLGLAIVESFTQIQGGSFRIETDGDLFKAILTFPKARKDGPPAFRQ